MLLPRLGLTPMLPWRYPYSFLRYPSGEDGQPGVTSVVSADQAGTDHSSTCDEPTLPSAEHPSSDPGDPLSPAEKTGSLSDSQLLNCLHSRSRRNRKVKRYGVNGEPATQLFDRTCRYCGVLRNSPADLRRHLRKHTGERPFACTVCKRAFKAKRSLQYHQYMHHGIQFKNTDIAASFSDAGNLLLKEEKDGPPEGGWVRESPSISSPDQLDDSSHSAPEMKESHGLVNHCSVMPAESLETSTYHNLQNESQDTGIESNGEEHPSPASRELCLHKHPQPAHSFQPISPKRNTKSPDDNSADEVSGLAESPDPYQDEGEEERYNSLLSKRTCQFCSKVCPKPSDLKRHLMVHTGERPFKCDICGKAFKAKGSMQYHQKAAHGADIELSQGLEERYLRLKHRCGPSQLIPREALDRDMLPLDLHRSPDNMPCKQPDQAKSCETDRESLSDDVSAPLSLQTPRNLLSSEDRSQPGRNGMCQADSCCSTSLDARPPLILADTEHHEDSDEEELEDDQELSGQLGKEVIVKEESQFIKNRISIKNETVLVTRLDGVNLISGVRTSLYKCHMCGKMFNYLSRLQCHLSVHFERHMTTYQCSICGANFKFKTQLLRHSRLHNRVGKSDMLTKQYSEGSSPKESRGLSTPSSLSEGHADQEDADLKGARGDGVEPEVAQRVNVRHQGLGSLSLMQHYSNRPTHRYHKVNGCYSCLFCKKTFFRLFSLQRHERMHTGVKPCYCKECGKGFSEPRNLRQHILRFHNDGFQMDFVKKARKRAIIASLRSSARAMRAVDFSVKDEPMCEIYPNDTASCSQTAMRELSNGKAVMSSPNAKEMLQKEDLKEDVTIVIPADVPVEKEGPSQAQNCSGRSEANWSEAMSEQDQEDYMNTEIMAAPKRPLLSFRKEGVSCKSRRKSSVPVKIENMSPPHQPAFQDTTDTTGSNNNNKLGPDVSKAVVKEEPVSPLTSHPVSSGVPTTPISPVLFSNNMGMTQSSTHPLFLSSHLLPSSGLSVNPVMSIPITVQVPVDAQAAAASSSSSRGMGLMAQVSPNDFLVGYPRVKWDGNPLAGIPNSEMLPRRRSLPTEATYTIHNAAYSAEKNGISTDGRKVTSLSRTHSRLHVVNAPVNREKVCKPMLLPDGRSIYRCVFCNKDFPTYSDINRHMDFHEDIRPYKCKFCDYYARTNSQLKVHMMRHQGIREFCCKLCNYKGVTQSDLNRHMKSQIHMLKSRNECPNCLEGFVTPKNLERHMVEICQGRSRSEKPSLGEGSLT